MHFDGRPAIIGCIMKIGIIISLVLLLIVGGIVTLALNTPPDNPTRKTAPQQLEALKLPADLPAMVPTPTEGSGDARAIYQELFTYYTANAKQIEGRNPPTRYANTLTDLLVKAAQAPMNSGGFFDDQVPAAPGSRPAFGAALEVAPAVVLNHALEGKSDENTRKVAHAVWIAGQRAFEQGKHIYIRREGLNMMQLAGSALYRVSQDDAAVVKDLQAWSQAINRIAGAWDEKIQMIQSVRQPIGDLLNIAANDQDPSFRASATAWLGVAKFNPGHRGNEKAIVRLIEKNKADDNAMIAQAAAAADAFTREDLRKLH